MKEIDELAKAIGYGQKVSLMPGVALLPARGGARRWQRLQKPLPAERSGSLFNPAQSPATPPPAAPIPPPETAGRVGPRLIVRPTVPEGQGLALRLEEEKWIPVSRLRIADRQDAAELFRFLSDADREKGYVVNCNAKSEVLNVHLVGLGTLSAALIEPREVFKTALLTPGTAKVYFVHNHPSGVPEPSDEDRNITRNLEAAGAVLGIAFGGHLVIANEGWADTQEPNDPATLSAPLHPWDPDAPPAGEVRQVEVRQLRDGAPAPRLTNASEAAVYFHQVFTGGTGVYAALLDTKNRPRGVALIGHSLGDSTAAQVARLALETNAFRVVLFMDRRQYDQHQSRFRAIQRATDRVGHILLDVVGVGETVLETKSAFQSGLMKSLEELEKSLDGAGKSKPKANLKEASGAGVRGTSQSQLPSVEQAVKPITPPHSRRTLETLLYWIEKTGTRNVRIQDVVYYATDAEIGQLINHLRDQYGRESALDQLLAASQGELPGAVELEELGEGRYRARPAALAESDAEADAADAPEETPPEEPPTETRSFWQTLADGIGRAFGRTPNPGQPVKESA